MIGISRSLFYEIREGKRLATEKMETRLKIAFDTERDVRELMGDLTYKERIMALVSLGEEIGVELNQMRESCAKADKLRADILNLLDSMDGLS